MPEALPLSRDEMNDSEKIDLMLSKIERLETAIAGDKDLGLKGFAERLEEHEKQDEQRHVDTAGQISALKTEHGLTRSFVKGAAWVIGVVFVVVEVFVSIVK